MTQDQLTIESVTGVDVEFQIAGPGSRSYAFVVDWHIRFLLALAWMIVAFFIVIGSWSIASLDDTPGSSIAMIFVPAMLIYFLYQPVAELVTRGRSPGKRIAGVRIISRTGDVPSIGALLIRNLFRLVDSLPALYVVGLVCTMFTKQHVRIGDLAAGTLLVIDHDRDGKALARADALSRNPNIDPQTADLIDELLERWKVLEKGKRRELATALLLQVDPQIERKELALLDDRRLHVRLKAILSGTQP
jgi:uncharacterized RDD family membrane protein YckC